jgi:hypothetical protein
MGGAAGTGVRIPTSNVDARVTLYDLKEPVFPHDYAHKFAQSQYLRPFSASQPVTMIEWAPVIPFGKCGSKHLSGS